MADPEEQRASSDDLAARIAEARAAQASPKRARTEGMRGWELAFRMVLELVVGIAIGGAIGYGIDWLIGSLPAFTLVFGLLGFVAGVRVMLRSAEEVHRRGQPPGAGSASEATDGTVRSRDNRHDERGERGERG